MAVLYPLQESFAAGEISPLLRGRTSIDGYKAGCQELTNMIPDPRGPARGRGGSFHVSEVAGDDGRIFALQNGPEDFFVAILTDFRLRMFNANGTPISPELVTEGTFDNGGAAWNATVATGGSEVTFNTDDCLLDARPTGGELITNGDFTTGDATGWTERNDGTSQIVWAVGSVQLIPNQNGGGRFAGIAQQVTVTDIGVEHSLIVEGGAGAGLVHVRCGLTNGSGEYLDTFISADSILPFTPPGDFWLSIDCETGSVSATLTFISIQSPTPGFARISQDVTGLVAGDHTLYLKTSTTGPLSVRVGTADKDGTYYDQVLTGDTLKVTVNIPATSATISLHLDSTNSVNVSTVSLIDPTGTFDEVTPWPEAALHEIHVVEFPEGTELHLLHKNYPPQLLKYSTSTGVFTYKAVSSTNFPPEWTGSNYPRTGCFLWGRLWYGGPPDTPQQFWGSHTSNKKNFIVPGTGAIATDPVTYTVQKFGAIQWMEGTKSLLIGTTRAEYVVHSESRFTDVKEVPDIQQQSAYGSNSVQPVQVGDQVMYVSLDGRKIRALQYEWSADNWLSQDLTFFSEHVTDSGVRELTWHQNPDNLLAAVLDNGNVAVLSYQRDQNVWGWGRFEEASDIKSIASPTLNGSNYFIRLAQLTAGLLELEYEQLHRSGFVDAAVYKRDSIAFTTVDGLDHLEGRTVRVLVDDIDNPRRATDMLATHPDRIVSGGAVALQGEHTEAVVGLGYTPKLVTLPLESPNQQGSQLTSLKQFPDVYVAVKDSFGITINGQRPPDRNPVTPMNTREPDATELVEVADMDWSQPGSITVEQELSLPVTILYIAGKTQMEHV